MRVRELIAELEKQPREALVFIGDMHIDEEPIRVELETVNPGAYQAEIVWLS